MKVNKRLLVGALLVGGTVFATNGDLLIGVGPVSRSMGGVGIGLPTDADSVVFFNPALITYYKTKVFSFGGTLFMPHTKAKTKSLLNGGQDASATSNAKYFAIPSIGVIAPINDRWVFGIAAYGISGMGVDYRNTNVSCGDRIIYGTNSTSPAGCYTNFQGMELSPSLAYRVTDKLSIGFGLDLVYGALDLGHGLSSDYAVGGQFGIAYKYNNWINIGAAVKTPIKLNFSRVYDFNNDGKLEGMTLEQPWQFGVGVGLKPTPRLSVGADLQYIKWSDADGYKDFGWDDQWVVKVGGAYRLNDRITLRAGYNYGKSPIDGRTIPATQKAEGNECMRIIGFPAIVENHLSVGMGVNLTQDVTLDIAYMHAFENSVTSRATNGDYWKSKLSEDSVSLGITWSF